MLSFSVTLQNGPHNFAHCCAVWKTKTRLFSTESQEKRCQKHLEFVVPDYQVFLTLISSRVLSDSTKTNDMQYGRNVAVSFLSIFVGQPPTNKMVVKPCINPYRTNVENRVSS